MKTFARACVLVIVFTAAAVYEGLRVSALTATDVWLHLRTGRWILQNNGVPHNGLFSQYLDSPWVAHAWFFDVIVAAAYKLLELRALPLLLMIYSAGIALALYILARNPAQNFWPAVLLTAIAQLALWHSHLEPMLSSLLLLALELTLLFALRREGNLRRALWLPILFVLWANLDIHFVYGLLVLLLFLTAGTLEAIARRTGAAWKDSNGATPSLARCVGLVCGCVIATLVSPYGTGVYEGATTVFGNPMLRPYLHELQALRFRRPQEFVLLLLAMAAFFLLGHCHSRDLFSWALMVVSTALSISTLSASWVVVVCSVGVIASAVAQSQPEPAPQSDPRLGRMPLVAEVVAITAIILLLVAIRIPSNQRLLARLGDVLPVKACDYIQEHKLPEPLFNTYEWGGFITWYLPDYPVAIDTRHEVYGDEANVRYFKITNGQMPIGAESHFARAGTVVAPSNSPMAIALAAGPRFTPVYRDDVALVLVRTALLKRQ